MTYSSRFCDKVISLLQKMLSRFYIQKVGSMKLVFDIGMYDGSDTDYYLSEGYKVIAVEANANLIEKAKIRFNQQISSGQLVLVNRAICKDPGAEIKLNICGDDLGSSSVFAEKIQDRNPLGSYSVAGTTILELIEKYGCPYFIKVDIEGSDRNCILPLDEGNRPQYISFEVDDDIEELVAHLKKIGFTKFKTINQCNFNELNNQESLTIRIKKKLIYLLGYSEPKYVRRNGRFFVSGHSAGPAPWASDGKWQDSNHLLSQLKLAASNNKLWDWYDVHAM
jgi:FkbM family methyltransferase